MSAQGELDFNAGGAGGGHERWLADRKQAAAELARRLNLPLGHEVEVWLVGGIRLQGKLQLREEALFVAEEEVPRLALRIGRTSFMMREMESCVRLD